MERKMYTTAQGHGNKCHPKETGHKIQVLAGEVIIYFAFIEKLLCAGLLAQEL